MSDCCKVRYEAFDGKLFDTQEACKEHNANPWVWVVTTNYRNMSHNTIGIYLDKDTAYKVSAINGTIGEQRTVTCIAINTDMYVNDDVVEVTPPATAWFSRLFGVKD